MMAMPDDLPFENAPDLQQEMQWGLDALLRGTQPSPKLWTILPLGPAMESFQALRDALPGGEPSVWKAFRTLTNTDAYKWLKALRNEPIPPRPGAEDEEEEREEDPRFRTSKNGKKVIVRISEDDIDALPDKEYLINDILEKGTVSMIYGPAGTGKTFNALHIAYCTAHGVPWFGHQTVRGKAWYINTEGGRGLKPRTQAWRKEYKRGKTSNIEFITWPVHLKEHSQELINTVDEAEEKPVLLIIDNYSMCATGTNQNDQMEVTRTLMVLHEIAQKYGCHCLLVHHSNWNGKVNGSAAFRNHVDTMLDLSQPSKEGPIFLRSEKDRDGPGFADMHLELKIVSPYAHPITGENITSCVVVESDAPVQDGLSPKQRQCLDLLCEGMTFAEWLKLVKDKVSI